MDTTWVTDITAGIVTGHQRVQSLWGGYGELMRLTLKGARYPSVILKVISPPEHEKVSYSHKRKLRSYAVEQSWYQSWSHKLDPERCRVPRLLGAVNDRHAQRILLEDLVPAGFPHRHGEIMGCLTWLANFHATFLGTTSDNLWPTGTYWHLETRPDELRLVKERRLRVAASQIDENLKGARFQTLVHGDAKLANFCFGDDSVAAVDFQYVGGGCGMKDVAYLLSCLDESTLTTRSGDLLVHYFNELRAALPEWTSQEFEALEREWRELYQWAWADFMRFLAGWSPGYFANCEYGRRILLKVLREL